MARWMKYNPGEILDSEGPLLTRKLAHMMRKKHRVSIDAARKGIERAYKKGRIKRIKFMSFGRREHLYYSLNTSQPVLLKKALIAIENRRPIIYRLWKALQKEKILPHRDGLKITGLPTKQVGKKESYKDVIDYLIKLGLAFNRRIVVDQRNIGFLVMNVKPPISRKKLASYARELISQERIIQSYLWRAKSIGIVKNVKTRTQVGSRIFDVVGEAVSRRYMVVVFDFNLIRETDDYDIEGLLDRVFSVYRKKFKQIVITYCVSKKFSKAAQHKAMTGRLKQINLIRVEMSDGQLATKKIDGISRETRGEMFENQIRYILKRSGFRDIQRGLKIYKNENGLTEKKTSQEFTDIDIITGSKEKVVICELKNWYIEVPQNKIEEWVQNKLNLVVDYLREKLNIQSEIEAWYIVSRKSEAINEDKIKEKCKCNIRILSKIELINDVVSRIDRFLANELRPIVIF